MRYHEICAVHIAMKKFGRTRLPRQRVVTQLFQRYRSHAAVLSQSCNQQILFSAHTRPRVWGGLAPPPHPFLSQRCKSFCTIKTLGASQGGSIVVVVPKGIFSSCRSATSSGLTEVRLGARTGEWRKAQSNPWFSPSWGSVHIVEAFVQLEFVTNISVRDVPYRIVYRYEFSPR